MAEPALSGTAAAIATTALSAGGVGLLSIFNNIPLNEYIPGTLFTIIGAVGWQFIVAQAARETAAKNGTPKDKRPTVDFTTVGYAMFSAPLVCGALIALVHLFGGNVGVLSLPGFIVGGAAGPTIVQRAVALLLGMLPTWRGGGQP